MTNIIKLASASVLALALTACAAPQEKSPMAQGEAAAAAMVAPAPSTNIVEAAVATDSLSTLVALVKQAQLVDTLASPGPFTVFAPTNDAFAVIPAATTSALMEDANREMLQGILTYHVVAGKVTAADLIKAIGNNGGSYTVATVAGGELTFRLMDGKVKITDGKMTVATVTAADLMQTNGVVHVINSVLMPEG